MVYSDDSIKEIDKLMNRKEFYLTADNKLSSSPVSGTLDHVVTAMNSGVVYE